MKKQLFFPVIFFFLMTGISVGNRFVANNFNLPDYEILNNAITNSNIQKKIAKKAKGYNINNTISLNIKPDGKQPGDDFYDWGDAPDLPYPTLSGNNGAFHLIDGVTYLGSSVDPEPDGQTGPLADGDDNDGNDDDDGVVFTSPIAIGQPVFVTITASTNSLLNAWFDFNSNGFWGDPGEQIFIDQSLSPGPNNLSFVVPASAIPGQSFVRFRVNSNGGINFDGFGYEGEVEDYLVTVDEQVVYDWGDAPDLPYPTVMPSNGAHHVIDGITYLGNGVDPDPDGQPEPYAAGDDNDGNDDEDGVILPAAINGGVMNTITVVASVSGYLNAWIDFNGNGSWADAGEQIFTDKLLSSGSNNVSFYVPASAVTGMTFARFRFSSQTGIGFTGLATDGEVEDYHVEIEQSQQYDYGDAPDSPYPTLSANNGAYHLLDGLTWLGSGVDPDPDGQPDPFAAGDDNDGNDDEDGVTFTSVITTGGTATVTVVASVSTMLNAWIDFNANGSWADAGEQIFTNVSLNAGANNLTFSVPSSATVGQTFARFRVNSNGGISYDGYGYEGEVEDYQVLINAPYKWIQHPDLTELGMDIDVTSDLGGAYPPHIVADDFECNMTGPLANITIWGSWYHDNLPFGIDPSQVSFTLSIHKDIPADSSSTGYSMPGDVLWYRTFMPGDFTVMPYANGLIEGWYDPEVPNYEPLGDTVCWMYSFNLDTTEFIQMGTPDIPVVYWLDVQATPLDNNLECRFGWKSSVDHWNDNAVWGIGFEPYPGPWNELYHPQNGDQVDMAFAIAGLEAPNIMLDVTAMLEGPFNGTDMNTDLNMLGLIPSEQPFAASGTAPWSYNGLEKVMSIPNSDIVDWVLVELRETPGSAATATSSTVIDRKAAFITKNGKVVALDGISLPKFYVSVTQNLYVVLYHRNHIGIMSSVPLMSVGNVFYYDFTTGLNKAYNNGQKDIGGGIFGMTGGDFMSDGTVDGNDYSNRWLPQAGTAGYLQADGNLDGQVDNKDKNDVYIPNIGVNSQIP